MRFEKRPRQILPRHERGADWGVERWLILDAGRKGRVFWWPGSTEWAGLGMQAYRPGQLLAQTDRDTLGEPILESGVSIPKGCRLTAARLNAPEVRAAIAKALGLKVSDIPELDPKASWIVVK